MDSGSKFQWWTPETNRNDQKITGAANRSTSNVKAADVTKPRSWHIFAGRFNPATTSNEILDLLRDAGINAISCEPLKRTEKWHETLAAFRIVVDSQDKTRFSTNHYGQKASK